MSRSGDEGTRAMIDETLRNDSLAPPKRLRAFVDGQINYLNRNGWRNGCLVGNFTAEASEHSEVIRKRIVQIFEEMSVGGVLFESGCEKRRPFTQERLR
jgi:TetR/AcrR family transcriptional regulator, transcriptional repressor for nem operon